MIDFVVVLADVGAALIEVCITTDVYKVDVTISSSLACHVTPVLAADSISL
jgi:hypothetical protein